MQISMRSHVIAGVAMVGASAIAVTPITQPDVLPSLHTRTVAVDLLKFDNPVTVFAQTLEWTVEDIASLISAPIADPVPILRTLAVNQFGNGLDLLVSAGALGVGFAAAAFNIPFATITAITQVLNNDIPGALATLQTELIGPITTEINGVVIPRLTKIVQTTIDHIQALASVLPSAVQGIAAAVGNSVTQTFGAVSATVQQTIAELQVLNPEGVWNAVIDGVLGLGGVIDTLRATTIGGGPTSISTAVLSAQNDINLAIGGPASQLPQPVAAVTVSSNRVAAAEATPAESTPVDTTPTRLRTPSADTRTSGKSDSASTGDVADSSSDNPGAGTGDSRHTRATTGSNRRGAKSDSGAGADDKKPASAGAAHSRD